MAFIGCNQENIKNGETGFAQTAFSSPQAPAQNNQSETQIDIITTIPPLYSLTANLIEGAPNVTLANLVPPNVSVHNFTFTPDSARKLAEAELIVMNGLELEEFLEENLADSQAEIVDTSIGVELISLIEPEEQNQPEQKTQAHGEYDPHIWLSPDNAKIQAENIAQSLVRINPQNAHLYLQNLEALNLSLDNLSLEISEILSSITIQPYLVFHDAYQYFEKEFGVNATAYLEEFPGKEPSASYLAALVEKIKSKNIKIAFSEPQFSPKLLQTLSQDYDLTIGILDPLGQAVSKEGYFQLIRANAIAFKEAFK